MGAAKTGTRVARIAESISKLVIILFLVFILTELPITSDILEEPRGYSVSETKPLFQNYNSNVQKPRTHVLRLLITNGDSR